MYGTAVTMIGHLSVAPAYQEGLYTPERHLYYLAMETFIYEYRKSIGMLSAYAEPFYSPTEENQQKKDIIKEASVQNNDKEATININNDKTNKVTTPISTEEKKSIQEANNVIEEDWVQVKRNAKTRIVREAIQEAYIKNVKNRYAVLKVDEEVVEEKDEKKKSSVFRKAAEEQRGTYNINDITVNEMLQHINEYKMKDVIVNALEETKNDKKNSSAYHKISSNSSVVTKEETEENIIADSDSEIDVKTDDDDSITDDDDLMSDDENSVDSFTMEDLNEEEKIYVERLKNAVRSTVNEENTTIRGMVDIRNDGLVKTNKQMKRIRYQNNLLMFRLEKVEDIEKRLNNELQAMKEVSSKYVDKVAALESALKKKTELLLNALRNKG